jgi:Flp pilus assembly protein TadG
MDSPVSRPRNPDPESGQTLVEFALVLPIFLMVVFGLLDVGRLVYTNSALSQAAREGARLAAAEASWVTVGAPSCVDDASQITAARPGAHVCPTDVATFKSHVIDAVNRMTMTLGPVTDVHLSCNAGDAFDPAPSGAWTEGSGGNGCDDGSGNPISATGDLVSVRVEYTYNVFTPIISSFLGAVPLSGSASMVIN